MFSEKSFLYQSIQKEIVLEMHNKATKNLRFNIYLRVVCIMSILVAVVLPWYIDQDNKNFYLFMICSNSLLPQNCHMFVKLEGNCYLDKNICDECSDNFKAGLIFILVSGICIIFQIINIFIVSAFIRGNFSCKNQFFCISSLVLYIFGFICWVYFSRYKLTNNSANCGLTAAFMCLFLHYFVTGHFYRFKKHILEYYTLDQKSEDSSLSIQQDQ